MEPLVFGKQFGHQAEEQLALLAADPTQKETCALIKLHLTQVGLVFHAVDVSLIDNHVSVEILPNHLMGLWEPFTIKFSICPRASVYREEGQWISLVGFTKKRAHPNLKSALRRARRFVAKHAEKPTQPWHEAAAQHFGVIETLTPTPIKSSLLVWDDMMFDDPTLWWDEERDEEWEVDPDPDDYPDY